MLQKTYTVSILEKKRAVNDGQLPKYYVEDSREAIIDRDVYLKVQAEMKRRVSLSSNGKKRIYSSKYALSGIVFCAHCGETFRRVVWNNHGCKSIVWRCLARIHKKHFDIDCEARTLYEEDLHQIVVDAINEVYSHKSKVIPMLLKNIDKVLGNGLEQELENVDVELTNLQRKLISISNDDQAIEDIGNQIIELREERQQIQTRIAECSDKQIMMQEFIEYLDMQNTKLENYNELLVRRLVEKIIVFDDRFEVVFKSGVKIDVSE